MLYSEKLDISSLNNLKRHCLDSKNSENNMISIEEFLEIKNKIFKGKQYKVDSLLLEEIKANDKQIDLCKLVEVIDICNFFPFVVKKLKNQSNDIYYVLSSNMRENFDVKAGHTMTGMDPRLAHNLEIIWVTIN